MERGFGEQVFYAGSVIRAGRGFWRFQFWQLVVVEWKLNVEKWTDFFLEEWTWLVLERWRLSLGFSSAVDGACEYNTGVGYGGVVFGILNPRGRL